jgi:Circadian oscillating protein COP23
MNSYFSSICTAILLPISLISSIGNNPAIAVSSGLERSNIQPSDRLISDATLTNPIEKIQLFCGISYNTRLKKNVPTTIAQKGSEKRAIAQWLKPMGDYWTPERRCQQVSQGMQAANSAGNLKYITSGKMNGQRVICTETEVSGDCNNLLMALRVEDKSLKFLGEIKEIFNGYNSSFICGWGSSSGEPGIDLSIDLDRLWENSPKIQ